MIGALAQPSPLRGTLLRDEPMARHTTWRVGGPADCFYMPADVQDLADLLRSLPADEPVFWLGLGSNLLVRDGGVRGTVIAMAKSLDGLTRTGEDSVRVEAGVPCAILARFCAREGLAGAEFLVGIPGTFGGALAMNAGCFGGETWRLVAEVETIDRSGEIRRRRAEEFDTGYRRVRGPAGEWFVAATLRLGAGEPGELAARMREWLDRRSASQPTQQANAGSVFRNPKGDFAGRLIEASGLKGFCIGGACVSERHANFIVNTGTAKAADIEALIAQVAERVEVQHGIRLEPEVRVVGEP
ncbi:MAG: UDP-N-acetylmuramate dehydrogenase [Gammaproteobacteria bacterium]|nr:UDP-N-acetylmuramate dehydrogenase [Gammaproteobacteria bacterium]